MSMIFGAVGDYLAQIAAAPPPPKTLSEHLIALFMSVAEFYYANDIEMPTELATLLRDMRRTARRPDGAHALELMRAVHAISRRESLRNDASVRIALSAANTALIHVNQ